MAGVLDTIGSVLGTSNRDQINAAKDTLYDISAKADQTTEANKALMGQYLRQMQDTYGAGSQAYSEALQNVADAIGNRKDFSYGKKVDEFLDPARQQRMDAAANALNNSAASSGGLFGSSYLQKLLGQQQAMASDEYAKALDRMMQDRSNALQEWQTGQQKINNLTNLASLYGNDRTALSDALSNYYSNLASANNANLQTYSNIGAGLANLEAQKNNGVWDAVGGMAKIAGSIFGGGA
jgi:hypothetical protein